MGVASTQFSIPIPQERTVATAELEMKQCQVRMSPAPEHVQEALTLPRTT